MSSALAHEIIASSHAKASSSAKGAKQGTTVGARMRDTLIFAAERLLWPLEVPRVALEAAAPKARIFRRDKAGVLPLAAKCQLEHFAAGGGLEDLPAAAKKVCRHYARSFLAAGVDQSVRIAEGVRVELWPDEEEPERVMRGHAHMGKDGSPIDLYAPAEGFLGTYTWYPHHLHSCLEIGQVFPAWIKPRGSAGRIDAAAGLADGSVVSKPDARAAFKRLLQLPPLAFSDEEIASMNIQGHTGHASPPEWARCIGESPPIAGLAELDGGATLAAGFSDRDIDALGHWMRDAGAKNEASASEAAAAASSTEARRAAAMASLPGKSASRGRMRNYYGEAGGNGARFSERFMQLRVRQRLAHTVRMAIKGYAWTRLPRGQADVKLLRGDAPAAEPPLPSA